MQNDVISYIRMAADPNNYKVLQLRSIDENLKEVMKINLIKFLYIDIDHLEWTKTLMGRPKEFLNYCQKYGYVTRYIWLPTKRELFNNQFLKN